MSLIRRDGVFLFSFGHVPFGEIVIDARGGRLYAMEPFVDGREGIRHEQEGVRLIFGEDFLEAKVGLAAFLPVKGVAALLQQSVHLRVVVMDEIELPWLGLAGVPDVEGI